MTTVYKRHEDLRLTAVDDEGVVLHLGSSAISPSTTPG